MSQSADLEGVVQNAIVSMGDTPRSMEMAIRNIAVIREVILPPKIFDWLGAFISSAGANNATEHAIGLALRSWDRADGQAWCASTSPITGDRRQLIYKLLKAPKGTRDLFDSRMPVFTESDVPIVIAEEHKAWYFEDRRRTRYYWDEYAKYLRERRGLKSANIAKLDEATNAVIGRMADPSQLEIFQSKGLVVGYVQSGKTTHFTGVLAKSVDAGYRLIIVLAGTMDVLRQQTQRRVDKELIGKEFLEQEYVHDKDWLEFNSHGEKPSVLGHFDWQRLTNSEEDYQSLKQGISALEFKGAYRNKPFFDASNLRNAEARLIVIKKNTRVIQRLVRDLSRIQQKLTQVPTLIIDDESDQASINTIDPRRIQDRTRTETNRLIVKLLEVLPRAQYVGYTATPFANALINADDAADLFPREFIVALPRPEGYMGVADFYDSSPLPKEAMSNQRAFVRDVKGEDRVADNLPKALDAFVLSGAIKLFRQSQDPALFRFEHHTMLVHHSPFQNVHETQAAEVRSMFESGGYQAGKGLSRLGKLFTDDFEKVSAALGRDLPFPQTFDELKPHLGECLRRLNSDKTVRIVNGNNKDDTPNFEKGPVWAIIVGGAKLSRGYTIEGLTVTYYRRVSTAADTLMQMGRWFGFRPGYRDLVRLFIGRNEPIGRSGKRTLDLYEAFRALCLDEEEFRSDIQKYNTEGLKPIQVPPLVPSHLSALGPTARNKMYNAQIVFRNFGASRSERTVAPVRKSAAAKNDALARTLLAKCDWTREEFKFRVGTEPIEFWAFCGHSSPSDTLEFLKQYVWETRESVLSQEVEYLSGKHGNPEIDRWLIIAPDTKGDQERWPKGDKSKCPSLPVRSRGRVGLRFKVISEPDHVALGNYLAQIEKDKLIPVSSSIATWDRPKTAVMLFYPLKGDGPDEDFISIGFALHFPPNHLKSRLAWTVRREAKKGEAAAVVVDIPKPRKKKGTKRRPSSRRAK